MGQTHGVPAILSLFVPGLGQMVKGHWGRAAAMWILLAATWMAYLFIRSKLRWWLDDDSARGVSARSTYLLSTVLAYGTTAALWLWGVVDAYRHPAGG